MVLVVKYKGELFCVISKKPEGYLLHTLNGKKAKKFGFEMVDRGEYELFVSKNEVEILGDSKDIGLDKGFDYDGNLL